MGVVPNNLIYQAIQEILIEPIWEIQAYEKHVLFIILNGQADTEVREYIR